MKTKSAAYLNITLLMAGMLIAACGPQNSPASTPQAWIDAPLGGSTIPLAPYQIIAHAGFPAGISQFELTITGQSAQTIPAPTDHAGQTLVYITQMWTPPAPGTYLIQVRAAGGDGTYGQMAEVQVQVGGETEPLAPEASDACIWTAAVNVFVRTGPGASIFPEITAVEAGSLHPVIGQSQDQQHWVVDVGAGGYVPKAERFGKVSGDCDVPVLPDPPPPAATNTPEPEVTPPQCSDGIDNDGDGRIDFVLGGAGVGDRECRSASDNDEANP